MYFVVYSGVAFSFACVSVAGDSPVFHVSADDLGVAGEDVEGDFCLGGVKVCYEVEEPFANADALVVG